MTRIGGNVPIPIGIKTMTKTQNSFMLQLLQEKGKPYSEGEKNTRRGL